ncbi:MAG: RtcB family protein [Patescibacteria group bacterium]|nr:RtcB family protein [Patescibacteria group bacterium]
MKIFKRSNFTFFSLDGEVCWQLDKKDTNEPIYIFAEESLLSQMDEEVFFQAENVSDLPGLVGPVVIMPDAHSGYGAPIGTVFAVDEKAGCISPGAVGYDINCGMRLIRTNLNYQEVKKSIEKLVNLLFEYVPPGVGKKGFWKINRQELKRIVEGGAPYILKKGIGWDEDQEKIEEKGRIDGADFSCLSNEAIERGISQLATLGSGNHYLEIQRVEKIFDLEKAEKLGIMTEDQIVVMIHTGSRGLGHQVCSDYLKIFNQNYHKFKLSLKDKQLVCAPLSSSLAKNYLAAMASAANFAFVNRELITHQVRKVFEKVFDQSSENLGMSIVYDVAHNIAKFESHKVPFSRKKGRFLIHRKGATRSFPEQPVILGGSMETGSYLLVGGESSLEKSYGSTAHGSGRTMSRTQVKKIIKGEKLWQEMKNKGIYVKSVSFYGLAEEAGLAYKDISQVVSSVAKAGFCQPLAYFRPVGNIKG